MGQLAETIKTLVNDGRYIVSEHASDRLIERGLMEWQVIAGMVDARTLRERPANKPRPAAEFEVLLVDGTACKAVWSLLRASEIAKLVTVHYFGEE